MSVEIAKFAIKIAKNTGDTSLGVTVSCDEHAVV